MGVRPCSNFQVASFVEVFFCPAAPEELGEVGVSSVFVLVLASNGIHFLGTDVACTGYPIPRVLHLKSIIGDSNNAHWNIVDVPVPKS